MQQRLTETIKIDRHTKLNGELFILLLTEIQARLDPLEILKDGLEAAIKRYADFVRDRTDLILGPKMAEIAALLLELTTILATAKADLEEGAEDALAQIQPQIDAKLAAVTTAIATLATAVGQANTARDGANAAAATATAAAGLITDVRNGTATIIATSGQTAAVGGRYKIDTSGGAISLNLPAAPAEGEHVTAWREGTNAATLARNGKTIEGLAENLIIDTDKAGVKLTYISGTWRAGREIWT